jgi:hypothetical protein
LSEKTKEYVSCLFRVVMDLRNDEDLIFCPEKNADLITSSAKMEVQIMNAFMACF